MFFFCKQKTAYEMRISDWSSDVCASDLTIYRPWRTYSTDLNVRLPPADFRSVFNSTTSPTADKIDLTDSWHERRTYFYVPKVANPGTTTSNYDKYRITSSTSATSNNGGVVQNLIGSTTIASGIIPRTRGGEWY